MTSRCLRRSALALGLVGSLAVPALSQVGRPDPESKPARRPVESQDRARDGSLVEGDPAPNFSLKTVDGKKQVTLASYRGRQPVVLIFGSYT